MAYPLALRALEVWSRLPDFHLGHPTALALPPPDEDDRPAVLVIARDRKRVAMARPVLERLADLDDGWHLVVAGGFGLDLPETAARIVSPGSSARRVRQLLDALEPVAIVVIGDPFLPVLVAGARDFGIPMIAIDVVSPPHGWRVWRLMRGSATEILRAYERLFTPDGLTYRRLRRMGAGDSRVEKTGPLADLIRPPRYRPEERLSIKQGLGARPVWCAVDVPDDEIELVMQALDHAARRAHRMLLVIMPRNPDRLEAVLAAVKAAGHEPLVRSEGDDPDPETSVYIADIWEEHGLWFSLSGVTYLGGTIGAQGAARSPMEPATLGSAVVHGPNHGSHSESFQHLIEAGASRQVTNWGELGDAVESLSVPDVQAALAARAWQLATSAADVGERLHALIRRFE
jgi:3-deoxy-D-manno-octulosonic-acid transferase